MARSLRIYVSEGIYHVMARGNNKDLIFLDESDYSKYFELLHKYKKKFDFKLFCYALMPNHVHLIIKTSDDGTISQIMQGINLSYTLFFNRKYNRVGHIFQGRFKSFLVQKDTYLLELSRYIHLNPIRAQITKAIGLYPYTSYSNYVGAKNSKLLACQSILCMMDENLIRAQRKYIGFVKNGISNGGQVLPSKVQVEKLSQT